jgi:predicted nucleic acid-binding protein
VPRVFFDTNVLLYLISGNTAKADLAEASLAEGGHVSVQVLNEFTTVARRKAGLTWSAIDEVLGSVRQVCTVHPLSVETHDRGRAIAERYGLSFYDALIVAAALLADCRVLFSEDLQEGQRFEGGLTVQNPLRV